MERLDKVLSNLGYGTRKELKQIQVEGINLNREFNFIYLKSSLQKEKYLNFLKFAKSQIGE